MEELFTVVYRNAIRILKLGSTFNDFANNPEDGRFIVHFKDWANSKPDPVVNFEFWKMLADTEGLEYNANRVGIVIYDSPIPGRRHLKRLSYDCGYKIGDLKRAREAKEAIQNRSAMQKFKDWWRGPK